MQYRKIRNTEGAILGDIDGDGFDDLAVGSPYEDNGAGAVRIYYGKKRLSGIQDSLQVSQKRIPLFQFLLVSIRRRKNEGKKWEKMIAIFSQTA